MPSFPARRTAPRRRLLAVSALLSVSTVSSVSSVSVPLAAVLTVSALVLAPREARADIVGRLKITVKNAEDEKIISGATVVLKDSAGVRPDITLKTGADGTVTTPPLENRTWTITTSADLQQNDARDILVAADVTTEVEVLLEPLKETIVTVTAGRQLVKPANTASAKSRNQAFYQKFPIAAGNEQSLTKALRANPGFVEDSVNQVHPRAEHSQTSIYINGFLVPGALQGRAGQFLAPSAIETIDVQTGGFAPEYGSELAAILNLTLRSGPIDTFADAKLGGGSYDTFQGNLTAGGQAGASYGSPNAKGAFAKKFSYLINATQRNTSNAIETPQPQNQDQHNYQTSTTVFGNFDYHLGERDTLSFIINSAPARTEIANRQGLSGSFGDFGQGFGYAGLQTSGATTTDAQGNVVPLISQQASGQDIYQRDTNTFGALSYRKQFTDTSTGLFSIGYTDSRLDILNNSPDINLGALPEDNSIEFNPTIKRQAKQLQFSASLTRVLSVHTVKFGGLYQDNRGDESYRLVPGSQTAFRALIDADGRNQLVPTGDDYGVDADGNPLLTPGGNYSSPTLSVSRSGYYGGLYVQDTWKVSKPFTANYGLRLDSFHSSQNLGQDSIRETELSPRLNLAYAFNPRTILRADYNRLFSQPPLAQGAVVGQSIRPQLVHMYETSIERQIGTTQTAKLAYYQKDFKNVTDTGILIEGTQIGAYTTHNLQKAVARGIELSYDLAPRNNVGLGGYAAYANVIDKPSGVDSSTGEELPQGGYTDHDQLNTVTAGIAYTLKSGANAGLTYYYGSGVESSRLFDLNTGNGTSRQARTEVNLSLASGNRLIKNGGLNFAVENLFDSRKVVNFQSAFSGTRFQQGRRILLSAFGKF